MNASDQIQQVEQRLQKAMLSSDLVELDALLSDELLVTGPDGQLVGKAEDLATHRAGRLRLSALVAQETKIKLLSDDVAVVFALMSLRGTFQEQPFEGSYRYTRVWRRQKENWQIIAAHISAVA
ncbi:nuclear transport factor 2 family protein [Larkinella insperata]|uniref:Nuclear transport factor 2 family protein n=1 Tax=Larkinella insperata TaxID=332158 RepID=A0ABW3Q4L7_9BACT|nr:nuclear transport factor 2 family protein [Larkinella insperata]